MPILILTFANTNEMYEHLKTQVLATIHTKDFPLLKNTIRIYTRETVTAEYYAMRFAEENVPSLFIETKKSVSAWKDFVEDDPKIEEINSFQSIFVIKSILKKKNNLIAKNARESSLVGLAQEILEQYENAIQFGIPLSTVVKPVIEEFHKYKKGLYTESERKMYLLTNRFVSKDRIQELTGGKVYFSGIRSIDRFQQKLIEKLGECIEVEVLLQEPIWDLLNEETHSQEISILSGDHILKKFPNFKNISRSDISNNQLYFYSSQEVQREVEFFSRHILGKFTETKQKNLHLTSTKFLVPDDVNYHIAIHNTFQKLGIPYAFTNEIHLKKISPYYTAVQALLELISSDFEKDKAFALFHNPCFSPRLPIETETGEIKFYKPSINSLNWIQFTERLQLYGFLDSEHRTSQHLSPTEELTWDNFWEKATYAILGEEENLQNISEEEKLELENYTKISSSLFHDLVFLKENEWNPKNFAFFFDKLLTIYLDINPRNSTDDKKQMESIKRNNENILKQVEKALDQIRSIAEIPFIKKEVKLELHEYLHFVSSSLEAPTDSGGGRVLRSGVVVGTLEDTLDISFDSIYVLGLNEDRLPKRTIASEHLLDFTEVVSLKNKMISLSRENFYNLFSQGAKEIHLSFINKDTIKDRPIYPSREYENVFLKTNQMASPKDIDKIISENVNRIPLFSYLEANSDTIQKLVWEKEAVRLLELKQIEKTHSVTELLPDWETKENPDLKKFDATFQKLPNYKKLKKYMFLPSEEIEWEIEKEDRLSIHRFVKFLECPRKYLYENLLHLSEEMELDKDYFSVSHLNHYQFISQIIDLQFTPQEEREKLLEQILANKTKSSYGVLQEVELRKARNFLEENLSKLEEIQKLNPILVSPKFGYEGSSFTHGTLGETPTRFRVDFLSLQDSELFLNKKLISSSSPAFKHQLNLVLEFLSITQNPVLLKELENYFQKKISKISAKIVRIDPKNLKTQEYLLNFRANTDFENYLNFRKNEFFGKKIAYPARPIPEISGRLACEYCTFTKVCPGQTRGFEGSSSELSQLEDFVSYIDELFFQKK